MIGFKTSFFFFNLFLKATFLSKTFHLECYFPLHGTIIWVKSQIQCFDFLEIVPQWSWNNVFWKISFMDKLMFVFVLIQKRKIQCWHFTENRHAKFQPAVISSSCGSKIPEVHKQIWATIRNDTHTPHKALTKWQKYMV